MATKPAPRKSAAERAIAVQYVHIAVALAGIEHRLTQIYELFRALDAEYVERQFRRARGVGTVKPRKGGRGKAE